MDHSQGPPSRTAVPQHQQWSAGPALDDMSQRLISGALRKVAWIGAVGAVFFAVAAPFSAAPSALADPRPPPRAHVYNVTLSCATIDGLSDGLASFQSGWKWYQGGINGTVLASESLTNGTCPPQAEEPTASL